MNKNAEFSKSSDEEILDWTRESEAIIKDVKHHVNEIFVSNKLKSNQFEIYINIKTLENNEYCIKASASGFQIAGDGFDVTDKLIEKIDEKNLFETPYALLNSISRGYVISFANRLSEEIQKNLMK